MTLAKEVFTKLRRREIEGGEDDLSLLGEVEIAIKSIPNFILGSFVYSKPNSKGVEFWPAKDIPLFFHQTLIANPGFIETAGKTFTELNNRELFISRLIHEMDERRAKRVELIHSCASDKCLSQIHLSACEKNCGAHGNDYWAIKSTLDQLQNIFPDKNRQQKATAYSRVVTGYFPDAANGKYLIVYCPFLVPDGKPPGNFFGVFKCDECCDALLDLLSGIQLAGTLIFSRRAVDAKLDKINEQVDELRKYIGAINKVASAVSNLESIVNPNYLFAANDEFQQLQKSWKQIAAFGKSPCHDVGKWDSNAECLGIFTNWLNQSKETFESIKKKLGDDLFEACFGEAIRNGISESTPEQKINAGFVIKGAINNDGCPFRWIGLTSYKEVVCLKNDVSALVFFLAVKALDSATFFSYEGEGSERKLILSVSITKDEKHPRPDLSKLQDKIIEKVKGDGISLHNGSNASAIAIMCKAAGIRNVEYDLQGGEILIVKCKYSFKVVP